MPAHMVRKHYLLSEAVELLGERKFGAEWLGGEAWAQSLLPPDEVLAARTTKKIRLQDVREQLAAHDRIARSKGVPTRGSQRWKEQVQLACEANALERDLAAAPEVDKETHRADRARYDAA